VLLSLVWAFSVSPTDACPEGFRVHEDVSPALVPAPHPVEADTTCPTIAPGLERRSPDTLAAARDLRTIAPATAGSLFVHGLVEIPAGTSDKWELTHDGRFLAIEQVDGTRRRIQYLPYPANYGFIPNTGSNPEAGGDGDPLDVVLLGPALPCGAVVRARILGVLRLIDDAEQDDKILAVPPGSPIAGVGDLDDLRRQYPGLLDILETWFVRYEGPGNRSQGVGRAAAAWSIVRDAALSNPASPPQQR
jgi:inorganic pyrophosphatase